MESDYSTCNGLNHPYSVHPGPIFRKSQLGNVRFNLNSPFYTVNKLFLKSNQYWFCYVVWRSFIWNKMTMTLKHVRSLLDSSYFYKKANSYNFLRWGGGSIPPYPPGLGSTPKPRVSIFFQSYNMPFDDWVNKNEKTISDRFNFEVLRNIKAIFSKSKVAIKIKKQKFEELIIAGSTYHINKAVSKIG